MVIFGDSYKTSVYSFSTRFKQIRNTFSRASSNFGHHSLEYISEYLLLISGTTKIQVLNNNLGYY